MNGKHPDLLIYEAYPRRVARLAALKAITKAVVYLVKNDGLTPIEARRKLYRTVKAYADSPAGQNPDKSKIPHPATWFNRGSYLDDPSEWQHRNETQQVYIPPSVIRTNIASSALQRAIQRNIQNGQTKQDTSGCYTFGSGDEDDG